MFKCFIIIITDVIIVILIRLSTLLSQIYPGAKIHKSEVDYHEWLEAKNASAVDKRRATMEAARKLRP